MLIPNLCLFKTPRGVTELRLMLQSLNLFEGTRRYHRDYGTYTGISEHILVLRNLYWSYETYTYLTDLILVLQNLLLYFRYRSTRRYYRTFNGTKVLVGTIEQISYTEVLVGTTGLILILRIREYS